MLYSILAVGPVQANDVIRLAKLAGVTVRTLKRAKRNLGVRSWKEGSGPGSRWLWELPDDEELLRPFKARDIDDLMERLISGSGDPPPSTTDRDAVLVGVTNTSTMARATTTARSNRTLVLTNFQRQERYGYVKS